jgi:hypothetical protein
MPAKCAHPPFGLKSNTIHALDEVVDPIASLALLSRILMT